jgi:hypothetical protein
MRVTKIFLLFFRNPFFFVYRHSDLEISCSSGTKTRHGESRCCLRAVVGTRSDTGLHDLKHLRKGSIERMMRVLGKSGLRVVSFLPCFRGGYGE